MKRNWTHTLFSGLVLIGTFALSVSSAYANDDQPNILWITCEDASPDFPMYGDDLAHTPNLSALAEQGCVYDRVFSTSPVCAPSRSTIITGIYAATLGTHHHRSKVELPPDVHCFPTYMREAGYYCTNNSKTDYNFEVPVDSWDENSKKAHWRNRPDPEQPFFAVFNFTVTHESQSHSNEQKFAERIKDVRSSDLVSTQAIELPPYIPDTPFTRNDWARMYNSITQLDILAGQLLDQLEADGLASNTIVMFYSDHGRGLPRGKRWLYDSGLQVPLIIRWPGRVQPASRNDELVSLIDMAPTVLSLAGIDVPANMQGRIFMGNEKQPEPEFVFATRDRMDEIHDMCRAVRDSRFKYIRNFYPERPYDLVIQYLERNPTMQELRRLHKAGELTGAATWFFQEEKPLEEFYDTKTDPFEIHNLADNPEWAIRINEMRNELTAWQIRTGDKGFEEEPKE